MVNFYYYDGPLKGLTIEGDFHVDNVGIYLYKKITFGVILKCNGLSIRIICDIAAIEPPTSFPLEAKDNVIIDPIPPLKVDSIDDEVLKKMRIIPLGGQIHTIGSSDE